MWNHHHFLIKLNDGGLSEGMRLINHGFARRLNAAYGRTGKGHLVRHSFFAVEITSHAQLMATFRYIDRNAVDARLCRRPEDWPWCGHAATVGIVRPRRFHDVQATLHFFGSRLDRARATYTQLVRDPSPGEGYDFATIERRGVVRSAA